MIISLRLTSVLVGIVSVVFPVSWFVYQQWLFAEWAKTQEGPQCGMPFLGALFGAIFLAMVLSFIASGLGLAAFVRLPKPRLGKRVGELLLLSLPFWLGGAFFMAVLYAG